MGGRLVNKLILGGRSVNCRSKNPTGSSHFYGNSEKSKEKN